MRERKSRRKTGQAAPGAIRSAALLRRSSPNVLQKHLQRIARFSFTASGAACSFISLKIKPSAEIFDQHDLRLPPAGLVKCHSFTIVRRREPEGHNVQHANSFHSVVFGIKEV